ncbi:MAG: histidinol-phosphate transaminase [Chromatiales bacterium]|nr:histidinol-phosphate transaminase [Chromatiales bacterium]
MSVMDLLRPEIRALRPYRPAEYVGGYTRLNANENPWRPVGDTTRDGLNRYPDPHPAALAARLAASYGVAADQALVTRGSSEAIDVLVRSFCRAGQDEIVICPPTFGMYEVYAQVQGAGIRRIPLRREQGYALPVDAILAGWQPASRLVFVCSPNNPTGNQFPRADVVALCEGLAGRGVVVLDAAYAEFAGDDPTVDLLSRFEHVVVLRTLSKALGLAGVRCGVLLGAPPLVAQLGGILPPYSFPTASQEAVFAALEPATAAESLRRRQLLVAERSRMATALARVPSIRRVWPSDANFIFVESDAAATLVAQARQAGILIRDFSQDPATPGGLRITIGTPEENGRLLAAFGLSAGPEPRP